MPNLNGGENVNTSFVVVDLETTAREAKDAYVVEWAALVVEPEWFGSGGIQPAVGGLVRPPIAIPPETSAIHHIIDADVIDAPTWDVESTKLVNLLSVPGTIAVAHNADYERAVLAPLNLEVPWLCTYKAALRVWPDAPGHSNECLRYWLKLGAGRSATQAPHSAAHDARVTTLILHDLLVGASVEDMVKWTDEPALLPTCPIGDWRGTKWSEIEESFLYWILKKRGTMRPDVVFCAESEITRREDVRRSPAVVPDDDSGCPF